MKHTTGDNSNILVKGGMDIATYRGRISEKHALLD